ncbi:MAG: hypothetical protein M1829_001048 [Trizodia sp. TS-e1964]|nr:MAG: hypothetical protein M1829_001048 [Trizodia sp. TS-e1964]
MASSSHTKDALLDPKITRHPPPAIPPGHQSPYLPTRFETLILCIYPATLLLGSLFSFIDPSTRAAPYNFALDSHPADSAPSYFARKDNIFNVFFVKIGWFWISLAYFLFLFSSPSLGPAAYFVLTPRRLRGIFRWLMVTTWWFLVTQWFFGPALIDRGFTASGGQCEIQGIRGSTSGYLTPASSSAACKSVGGKWSGGHDISGHVFFLVLGSAFLWMEVMYDTLRSAGFPEARLVWDERSGFKNAELERSADSGLAAKQYSEESGVIGIRVVMGVAVLSWWMLMMTAIYFHTWLEKLSGLAIAFIGIFVVYFLPRVVPQLRSLVGMPGI